MTTCAELARLVQCPNLASALREWAMTRARPIQFNDWQKGNAELRRSFVTASKRKRHARYWTKQVVGSWKQIMQEVHGRGWRGHLQAQQRKDREMSPARETCTSDLNKDAASTHTKRAPAARGRGLGAEAGAQGARPQTVKSSKDRRRLKGKQPVHYDIPTNAAHDRGWNLHRVIATTIITWSAQRRQRLLHGLAGVCRPTDATTQKLHLSLERAHIPKENKAAWVADQLSLALGGSHFAEQKKRWDRLAEATSRRKKTKPAICSICQEQYPFLHASEGRHRCAACQREFELTSLSARQTHTKRPGTHLVCLACRNAGITPQGSKFRSKQQQNGIRDTISVGVVP